VAQVGGAAEGLYLYSLRMLSPESVRVSDPAKAAIMQLGNQYQQKYSVPGPVYAQHAYDAFLILEQAVHKIDGPANRESIRAAIEKVKLSGTKWLLPLLPAEPRQAGRAVSVLRHAA
jgi:hypothetical protein